MAKAKKKKHLFRRLLIWLILLALAAGAVYLFVLPKWKAEATTTYNQYAARIGSISNSISFNGSVSVKNAETITADNAATVRVIYVEEEQHVKKDDRLMRLSDGTTVKASFDGQINLISPEVGDDVLPGMACTVTIPQEEAVDTVILSRSALSFGPDNSAYVLMYDENKVMQQVPVTIGVDNDNYVQITAGLKDGDVVYKEAQENANAAGGLFAMFSNMGSQQPGNNRQNNQWQNNTNRQNNMNNNFNRMNNNFGGMPRR